MLERELRSWARKHAWKSGSVTVVVRRYAYGPLVSVQSPPTTCPSMTGRRATDTLCAVVIWLSLCCRRSDKAPGRAVADGLAPVPSRDLWYRLEGNLTYSFLFPAKTCLLELARLVSLSSFHTPSCNGEAPHCGYRLRCPLIPWLVPLALCISPIQISVKDSSLVLDSSHRRRRTGRL